MKKLVLSFLALALVLTPILGQQSKVEASSGNNETQANQVVNEVEKYVELTEDGTLELVNVPNNIYEEYNLAGLESHFEEINEQVLDGNLAIDEDLNITEVGPSLMAVYGKWTYHWWGYDRKFNNSQTKAYVERLEAQSMGATMVTGVGAWFPPVAGIGALSAGYWGLMASRAEANNNGNGILVEVTWVNVFNMSPL